MKAHHSVLWVVLTTRSVTMLRQKSYQKQWLEIAQEAGDKAAIGLALGSLGNIYESLGDYPKAVEYHEQHLELAIEIDDLEQKGSAAGNLGGAYHSLGQYHKANQHHEQHLAIAQQMG